MNLDQLTYFIKVAELRHLTHASESLNISEPALSKSIARLEDEIGINLFDRVGRSICLNKNGEAFIPYAQNALRAISEGINAIESQRQADTSLVKIQSIPMVIFPGLLDSILSKYPDIKFLGSLEPSYVLEENLLTEKTDLCLTSRTITNSNLKSKQVNTDPLMIIVSENHPIAHKKSVTPVDLIEEKFIIGETYSSMSRDFNAIFEKEKNKPAISLTITNINETSEYIAKGYGIAVMSLSIYTDLLKRQLYGVKAVPVFIDKKTPYTITQKLYWRKNYNSQDVLNVKELIIDYFKRKRQIRVWI